MSKTGKKIVAGIVGAVMGVGVIALGVKIGNSSLKDVINETKEKIEERLNNDKTPSTETPPVQTGALLQFENVA